MQSIKSPMVFAGAAFQKALRILNAQYPFYAYRYKKQYGSDYPFNPIHVSPDSIEFVTGPIEPRERGHIDYDPYFMPETSSWSLANPTHTTDWGTKVAGDWDRTVDPFEDLMAYRSIHDRFENDQSWEETEYFKIHKQRIQFGNTTYCENVESLRDKCARIDELYESIKTEGYQSQKILNGRPDHEITVNIGRDGRILYNSEGRHRLSIAKVLDVDSIPVLVLAKHPETPEVSDLDVVIR